MSLQEKRTYVNLSFVEDLPLSFSTAKFQDFCIFKSHRTSLQEKRSLKVLCLQVQAGIDGLKSLWQISFNLSWEKLLIHLSISLLVLLRKTIVFIRASL